MPGSPWRRIRLVTIAAGLMADPIRLNRISRRQLDISHGCQDHTVLPYATIAVRLHAGVAHGDQPALQSPIARRRCRVHRIPSRVRDDSRSAPLWVGRESYTLILVFRKEQYLSKRGLTGRLSGAAGERGMRRFTRRQVLTLRVGSTDVADTVGATAQLSHASDTAPHESPSTGTAAFAPCCPIPNMAAIAPFPSASSAAMVSRAQR
jgi:hypothetical protein